MNVFSDIFNKSDKTPCDYIENVLFSISGVVGNKTKNFADIDKTKTKPVIERLTSLITNNQWGLQ